MDIGFIGLGNMGAPMAANLVKAGHAVTGYDSAGVSVPGVASAPSAAAAAAGRQAVVTMLPDGAILRRVAAEVIPAAAPGTLLIDCSTVDVASARAVAAEAAARGLAPLDAPVSGGTGGAAAGTLTFMVGGSEADFARAGPVLAAMGARSVHCGPAGNGQAAKLCNNMLLGISMIGTCEAFTLAERLGLSPQALFDVASTSSGSCWSLNSYCPEPGVGPQTPADRDYRPGFAAALMLKDLKLAQAAAEAGGAATPLGAMAMAMFGTMVEEGEGGRDFSAMLPRLKAMLRG